MSPDFARVPRLRCARPPLRFSWAQPCLSRRKPRRASPSRRSFFITAEAPLSSPPTRRASRSLICSTLTASAITRSARIPGRRSRLSIPTCASTSTWMARISTTIKTPSHRFSSTPSAATTFRAGTPWEVSTAIIPSFSCLIPGGTASTPPRSRTPRAASSTTSWTSAPPPISRTG